MSGVFESCGEANENQSLEEAAGRPEDASPEKMVAFRFR